MKIVQILIKSTACK